jgi:hypothetical protein
LAKASGRAVITDDRDYRMFSDIKAQGPADVIASL